MCRKVLITLGILCFLSTARAKADDVGYAYCPLGEGYVFLYDSLTGFQVLADLKCGEKVTVVDPRNNDRARVRTANGIEGYVQKSSLTAALPGTQRQPAATPDAGSQPPQMPQTPVGPKAQTAVQPKAQAQVTKPQAQAQPEPPSQPQPEAAPQTPQVQPQPQAELEAQAQPPVPPQPHVQPLAPAQPQPEPEALPQPQVQAPPPAQSQLTTPSQPSEKLPPPAAVAFTPFSTLGYEENVPRLEVSGGYSFMNAGTDALASRQNVNGFETSVAYNVNRWVAAEGNVAAYYKTITILNVGTFPFHDYLVTGGARVSVRKVFIHGLIGMDHLANNLYFAGPGPSSGNTVLAVETGGGVQWKVSSHIGVRTSVDYVMSKFDGWIQSSVRVSTGLVFNWGRL